MSAAEDLKQLGQDMPRLARMAALSLEETLGGPDSDTKRAKELSGILKDLTTLARDLNDAEAAPVTVVFLGETEDAGE